MTTEITQAPAMQEQVFAFLADPATYGSMDVRRIDTHAAVVILAGDRALKIKRGVRFPFLDYSTLSKRRAACDEEIRINRPAAPQIYRRVVPITQSDDGTFHIDGGGAIVEYAVEMARFDENATLDHLARAGALQPSLIIDIADAIAASHEASPVVPADGWIRSIPSIISANTTAFRASHRLSERDIDALDTASQLAFTKIRTRLEDRAHRGLVRRCHGDLHLANIVQIERKPVLFDAIEFDPTVASIDVLYDLSFTLMDLLNYGRRTEANILLNRYLAATLTDNLDGPSTLPMFMSMRAAIRANVLLARLVKANKDDASALLAARDYFSLAQRLISPSQPMLVAVGGLSGTGKTLLASALADAIEPLPGAVILRSDVTRKQHFQVRETQTLPAKAYQPHMSAIIYRIMSERAEQILSQGHSVILDAVFATPAERLAVADIARKLNLPFKSLFLVSDLATRMDRVGHRIGDASDATADLVKNQEIYDLGALDWHVINASGTPEQTLQHSKVALGISESQSLSLAPDRQ